MKKYYCTVKYSTDIAMSAESEADLVAMVKTFFIDEHNIELQDEEITGIKEEEPVKEVAFHWCADDIKGRAKERGIFNLTDKMAGDVLVALKNNHDASIGVNWDVIDIWTDNVLGLTK